MFQTENVTNGNRRPLKAFLLAVTQTQKVFVSGYHPKGESKSAEMSLLSKTTKKAIQGSDLHNRSTPLDFFFTEEEVTFFFFFDYYSSLQKRQSSCRGELAT
jgi:hypothetical protein